MSLGRYNWAPAMTVSPIFALEAPPNLGEGSPHLNWKTVIIYHPPSWLRAREPG